MNYLMQQQWEHLLFAHWPVPVEEMQALLPKGMQVDVAEGMAWISVVPFQMTNIKMRWMPKVQGLDAFDELNVRTYVRVNGEPGVYFFSLDANHRFAVWVARQFFHLNYRVAEMNCRIQQGTVAYRSNRIENGVEKSIFRAKYRPAGESLGEEESQLVHWLTNRSRLFTSRKDGALFTGQVFHPTWTLEKVEVELDAVQLVQEHGLTLSNAPALVQYSQLLGVYVTAVSRVRV